MMKLKSYCVRDGNGFKEMIQITDLDKPAMQVVDGCYQFNNELLVNSKTGVTGVHVATMDDTVEILNPIVRIRAFAQMTDMTDVLTEEFIWEYIKTKGWYALLDFCKQKTDFFVCLNGDDVIWHPTEGYWSSIVGWTNDINEADGYIKEEVGDINSVLLDPIKSKEWIVYSEERVADVI